MKGKLNRVRDWDALAKAARYCPCQLAASCGVSLRQLERFFKAAFRSTPRQWLEVCRLEAALNLLRKGSQVKEIAWEVGYQHPSHFIRCFKGRFGCTPGTWQDPIPGDKNRQLIQLIPEMSSQTFANQ